MCGILGGSKREWNYEAGVASLNHRGPDMQRISREDKFSFAFARLSIIDLSDAAMQPMTFRILIQKSYYMHIWSMGIGL